MRTCPYCKIEVGGDLKKCPVCQSKLSGEAEATYFPVQTTLKITSFFYKIQLFIVWAVVIAGLGADFRQPMADFGIYLHVQAQIIFLCARHN